MRARRDAPARPRDGLAALEQVPREEAEASLRFLQDKFGDLVQRLHAETALREEAEARAERAGLELHEALAERRREEHRAAARCAELEAAVLREERELVEARSELAALAAQAEASGAERSELRGQLAASEAALAAAREDAAAERDEHERVARECGMLQAQLLAQRRCQEARRRDKPEDPRDPLKGQLHAEQASSREARKHAQQAQRELEQQKLKARALEQRLLDQERELAQLRRQQRLHEEKRREREAERRELRQIARQVAELDSSPERSPRRPGPRAAPRLVAPRRNRAQPVTPHRVGKEPKRDPVLQELAALCAFVDAECPSPPTDGVSTSAGRSSAGVSLGSVSPTSPGLAWLPSTDSMQVAAPVSSSP